jgi:hypothetical protein
VDVGDDRDTLGHGAILSIDKATFNRYL